MQNPEQIRSEFPESRAPSYDTSAAVPVEPESESESVPRARLRRGFATMDAETLRQIARLGGRAAHERGHAHRFSPEEARRAGRKGGYRVSEDRAHMVAIGRLGGLQRWRNREED